MKKVAILCNGTSKGSTDRLELVEKLHEHGIQPYCGKVLVDEINEYFSEETAILLPIIASRDNTNPLVELKSMASVRKGIKREKIDGAIIYGVKNHAAMAIGAKLGGAKKILCVVNGSGNLFRVKGLKGRILRLISFPMLWLAYKFCIAICFQNEDDKALFIKKHLVKDNGKLFVTGGSGVNLETFSQKEMPKENRFLFLSRITPSKGIAEYIKAAEIVKKKYPDAIFDIVGPLDGKVESLEDNLLQKATEKGIVAYHGATKDVPSWMEKCRFFVYPSYYPEGVPRCAMQAISSGRPIITCNTQGCKETAVDGVNGFVIEPKNVEVLAEKMIWMIENPTEVEKMAIESRRLAENKFDVNKINQELIDKMNG